MYILSLNVECHKYVAVWYNNEWHVGKIIEVDENDNGCLVTFLCLSQGKPKESTLQVAQ